MDNFTPWHSLAGGLLIGLAALALMGAIGRVAGISQIAQGALGLLPHAPREDRAWRLAFLIGLIVGASVFTWLIGQTGAQRPNLSPWTLVLGGLLVGWGTSQGHGCTSGHGVCGLGRLSLRSLVATLTFMTTGALTVFVVRHVLTPTQG